jgi:hypothetical protein
MVKPGMQIDQEPRQHSSSYELKPMSRWWLVFALVMCVGAAFINGFTRPETWALIFMGAMVCGFCILCFPRYWLSKIND